MSRFRGAPFHFWQWGYLSTVQGGKKLFPPWTLILHIWPISGVFRCRNPHKIMIMFLLWDLRIVMVILFLTLGSYLKSHCDPLDSLTVLCTALQGSLIVVVSCCFLLFFLLLFPVVSCCSSYCCFLLFFFLLFPVVSCCCFHYYYSPYTIYAVYICVSTVALLCREA
jgi:hypothetical protein